MCFPSLVKICILEASFSLAVGFDTIAFIVPEDRVEILDEVKFCSPLAIVNTPLDPEAISP